MQVSQAAEICIQYHKSRSRPNTVKAYRVVLSRFCQEFGDGNLDGPTFPVHVVICPTTFKTDHFKPRFKSEI